METFIWLSKDEQNGEVIHTIKPKSMSYTGIDKTKPFKMIDDDFTEIITYPKIILNTYYWEEDTECYHLIVPDGTIKTIIGKDLNVGEIIEIEIK